MRLLKLAALLLLVGVITMSLVFIQSLAPSDAHSEEKQDFLVSPGESTADITNRLEDKGLVRNSFSLYLYLKLLGGKIMPGTYEISPSSSATEIGWKLGSGKYKTARITIIEGWRVTQIADYLEEKKLTNATDFLAKASSYEGYLFPDTYEVKVDITTDELIKLMRDNFQKKTAALRITPETVILASIVEREAKSDNDRPMIAGVYKNRIKSGMRLDADPTVQYAKGTWASVTLEEYRSVVSPYNTYLNDGLPPGPIANPGLKSLEAAANPASHDYYFFFHAKGETFFSKTYAEHRQKVRENF